jgi:putative aminopeptidase FrvX
MITTSALDLNLLAELCALPGVAGFEQPVARRLQEIFESLGIATRRDRIGNLVAHLPGQGPRVMLFAHMDEVGLLVRKIHPQGFLYVERLGGTSPHTLPGTKVLAWTQHGSLPGVIGAMPMHLANEHAPAALQDIYIDLGARSRRRVEELGVAVGTPVTFAGELLHLDGSLASKALDDRLGCWLLVELARSIQAQPASCDLHLAFLVQEENVFYAGLPVAQAVQPDYAIGVDATLAFDTPDLKDGQTDLHSGGGTVIKVMDRIRASGIGFVANPELRAHLERLAAENGLPFQREIVIGLSTLASMLPFAGSGLPVAAISFPLRYSHSPLEVCSQSDIAATGALLELAVRHPWQASL